MRVLVVVVIMVVLMAEEVASTVGQIGTRGRMRTHKVLGHGEARISREDRIGGDTILLQTTGAAARLPLPNSSPCRSAKPLLFRGRTRKLQLQLETTANAVAVRVEGPPLLRPLALQAIRKKRRSRSLLLPRPQLQIVMLQ